MKMQKSPPELVATFDRVFPDDPRAQKRPMFGYPAGFVNGNMFAGLYENNLVLRLSEREREELQTRHGAEPFEPMGRLMTGYVALSQEKLKDDALLRSWLERALEHGARLPPKQPKRR
jgi:TfoX/Sxy family transcriptional regulator of competence genes